MTTIKRLGPSEGRCGASRSCPDILELDNGDFAIIGADITDTTTLLPDAGCGPGEKIVRIPRALLVNARRDIPTSV